MATSTANTILKSASTSEGPFVKLLDITDYPDLGGTPNMLDTTDLTATKIKTSILGLQEVPDLTFEANYTDTDYSTLDAMTGVHFFELEFSNGGSFKWEGELSVYAVGAGVDEVRKMMITLSAETEMVFTAS